MGGSDHRYFIALYAVATVDVLIANGNDAVNLAKSRLYW